LFVLLASHASALPPTIVSRLRIERVHSTPEAPEERPWDESLSSMDDAQLVAQACDDPTPPSRRRAVGAILTRVASGAGRYAIGITGAIASRGRDAVTQFVEDAQRVLAEELRLGWSGDEHDVGEAALRGCLAAQEARRGCERYAPHDAVLLALLLTLSGGRRG
ncbi:MAG: hypothetical protein JSW65_02925, partial [Candidatus Bipolaricaulota bacterium]